MQDRMVNPLVTGCCGDDSGYIRDEVVRRRVQLYPAGRDDEHVAAAARHLDISGVVVDDLPHPPRLVIHARAWRQAGGDPLGEVLAAQDRETGWVDRKSTRLNSSHSSISYAVFCLKKKK